MDTHEQFPKRLTSVAGESDVFRIGSFHSNRADIAEIESPRIDREDQRRGLGLLGRRGRTPPCGQQADDRDKPEESKDEHSEWAARHHHKCHATGGTILV
jgi:hypothetical protein